jgi:hypothetical protein
MNFNKRFIYFTIALLAINGRSEAGTADFPCGLSEVLAYVGTSVPLFTGKPVPPPDAKKPWEPARGEKAAFPLQNSDAKIKNANKIASLVSLPSGKTIQQLMPAEIDDVAYKTYQQLFIKPTTFTPTGESIAAAGVSRLPGTAGGNRCAGPNNVSPTYDKTRNKTPIPGSTDKYFPTCDEYFDYKNIINAIEFGKSHSNPEIKKAFNEFACKPGTTTIERLSEVAAFFANISQETTGGGSTAASPYTGVAYAFNAYAEASCFGVCPAGTIYRHPTEDEIKKSGGEVKPEWWACDTSPAGDKAWFLKNVSDPAGKTPPDFTKDQYASSCPGMGIANGGYFGRGPKQLTYEGNYLWAGTKLYPDDTKRFVNNPNELLADSLEGWKAGLAYQLLRYTESGTTYTKPTMSEAINQQAFYDLKYKKDVGAWGFGQTINVINGGVECNPALDVKDTSYDTRIKHLGRINNYIELMVRFGVDIKGVTVENNVPANATIALGNTGSYPKSYSVDDLKYNIYLRRTTTAAPDYPEILWMTAPLADLFNDKKTTNPWGPYYLYYNDPDLSRKVPAIDPFAGDYPSSEFRKTANVVERLDCWGYTSYQDAKK